MEKQSSSSSNKPPRYSSAALKTLAAHFDRSLPIPTVERTFEPGQGCFTHRVNLTISTTSRCSKEVEK